LGEKGLCKTSAGIEAVAKRTGRRQKKEHKKT